LIEFQEHRQAIQHLSFLNATYEPVPDPQSWNVTGHQMCKIPENSVRSLLKQLLRSREESYNKAMQGYWGNSIFGDTAFKIAKYSKDRRYQGFHSFMSESSHVMILDFSFFLSFFLNKNFIYIP
jgi:hypothetical protein